MRQAVTIFWAGKIIFTLQKPGFAFPDNPRWYDLWI
jgi:hypothetical protein